MPRERKDFELLAEFRELGVGSDKRCAYSYCKVSGKTVCISKLVHELESGGSICMLFTHRN